MFDTSGLCKARLCFECKVEEPAMTTVGHRGEQGLVMVQERFSIRSLLPLCVTVAEWEMKCENISCKDCQDGVKCKNKNTLAAVNLHNIYKCRKSQFCTKYHVFCNVTHYLFFWLDHQKLQGAAHTFITKVSVVSVVGCYEYHVI